MHARTLVLVFLLALASSGCSGSPDQSGDAATSALAPDDAATSSPDRTSAPGVGSTDGSEVVATTGVAEEATPTETVEPAGTSRTGHSDSTPTAAPADAAGPQVCGAVQSATSTVYVEILRGSLTCDEAEALLTTYYHDPPEPPQGSGGFVSIGDWDCISTSAAEPTPRASSCRTAAGDEVAAWSEPPVLEDGPEGSADARPGESDAYEVSGQAVFTTPARAAYCILSTRDYLGSASVYCEVQASTLPDGHELVGVCPDDFGYYVEFVPGQADQFWCNNHTNIPSDPRPLDSDDGWVEPSATATLPGGRVIGVLQYGQVLRHGDIECTVQPDGLTCSTSGGDHGFVLNSARYVQW